MNSSLICVSCDQLLASVANKVEEMANSGNLLDTQVVYVMATFSSVTTVMTEDSTADSRVRNLQKYFRMHALGHLFSEALRELDNHR